MKVWIFDADDTLRRTTVPGQPCPRAPGEWELLPGVRRAFALLDPGARRLRIGVASNQDQIAYGHLDEATARRLLDDMLAAAVGGRPVDSCIRLCPHPADARCSCRKPAPGMILSIVRHFGVGRDDALFVGDTPTDEEAARRAGVRFAWARDFFGPLVRAPHG